MPEFDIIRRYFQEKTNSNESVRVGIGDDAAVLSIQEGAELVVAVDTLVAGVHFPFDTAPFDIGFKSLAVNLSDLAAMGASPQWLTLALTLPKEDEQWLSEFSKGLFSLADKFQVALVGGDTTQGPLTISVQVGGVVAKGQALLRSGAKPGDAILVTGTLGDAARGLQLLQQQASDIPVEYLARLNRPSPRVAVGLQLLGLATSCIDISDGLYSDLSHISAASGVGAVIEVEQLPLSEALRADALSPEGKYRLALTGGDDYELCFTVSSNNLATTQSRLAGMGVTSTIIGHITENNSVTLHSSEGGEVRIDTLGYQHFT